MRKPPNNEPKDWNDPKELFLCVNGDNAWELCWSERYAEYAHASSFRGIRKFVRANSLPSRSGEVGKLERAVVKAAMVGAARAPLSWLRNPTEGCDCPWDNDKRKCRECRLNIACARLELARRKGRRK